MSEAAARIFFSPSRTSAWSSAMRIRITPYPRAGCGASGSAEPHPRSAARRARDLGRTAEIQDALAHAFQPERAGLGERVGLDAAAVILDLRAAPRRPRMPSWIQGVLRPGVARDVGERFLERAVDRR